MPRLSYLLVLSLVACSGSDDPPPPVDSAPPPSPPDARPAPIDAAPLTSDVVLECPNPTGISADWVLIDDVSEGMVQPTPTGANTFYANANASGARFARDKPYIYVSFANNTPTQVFITDGESRVSSAWALGIKREVIRVNSGDSGIGGVTVSRVNASSLSQVTTPPPAESFAEDNWLNDRCEFVGGFLNEPETAIGVWYETNPNDASMLLPRNIVYILKWPDQRMIKFRILTYYYDGLTAQYELEWAPL